MTETLGDVMLADLATILDPAEFGESVILDGSSVTAIVEDVTTEDVPDQGVFFSTTKIHLAESSLEDIPVPQEEVEFNGSVWRVLSVTVRAGLATIILVKDFS